jgi:hypothetical protein
MFFVGLDLGQRQDFTAISVVERIEPQPSANPHGPLRGGAFDLVDAPAPWSLIVRHLERMDLGTPYTRVAERVCEIVMHPSLDGNSRLVVDATGVGRPVVDLLRSSGFGAITAVTITGGDSVHANGEEWYVPRRDLLAHLQLLMEQKRLTIARGTRETERLVRELESMSATGASREHDDLVIAVALACWRAKRLSTLFGTHRLLGIPP